MRDIPVGSEPARWRHPWPANLVCVVPLLDAGPSPACSPPESWQHARGRTARDRCNACARQASNWLVRISWEDCSLVVQSERSVQSTMCPRPNPLRIKRAAWGRCQKMLRHFTVVGQGPAQRLALDAGVDKSQRAERIPPEVDYRRGRVEQCVRYGSRIVGPTWRSSSMQLQSRAGFPTTAALQLPLIDDLIRERSSPVGAAPRARCEASPRRTAGRTHTQPVLVSRREDDGASLESPQVAW